MFAKIFQLAGATEAAADQFAASLNSIVALDQLLDYVAAYLADISGARSVYILLAQPITDRYTCRKALGGEWDIVISPVSKLLGWLSINQTPLDLGRNAEISDSLAAPERVAIQKADIGLIIPCFVIGRLSGLLLFGRREGGKLYRESDIALLSRPAAFDPVIGLEPYVRSITEKAERQVILDALIGTNGTAPQLPKS